MVKQDKERQERPDLGAVAERECEDAEQKMETDGADSQRV